MTRTWKFHDVRNLGSVERCEAAVQPGRIRSFNGNQADMAALQFRDEGRDIGLIKFQQRHVQNNWPAGEKFR